MTEAQRMEIEVGTGGAVRRIAVRRRDGAAPPLVWLGGFRSDMQGSKASAIDEWAAARGRGCVRFDYSGHGESGGDFLDGTIGRWLEEAEAVLAGTLGEEAPIVIGSSMGGWIALLLALARREAGRPLAGLILIAPAVDMSERLMWDAFDAGIRERLHRDGVWQRPSAYDDGPYPITLQLIEEGRRHLLLDRPQIELGCPVHILHGRDDPDVPLDLSLELVTLLGSDDVTLTVVHDGDHRLSRPQDITLLQEVVAAMVEAAHRPSPAS